MTTERPGWRDHPLVQLTLVRYREFYREPEAIFWVFIFPVLLTAGLGIAFRNRAPERAPVALVARQGIDDSLAARLERAEGLRLRTLDDSAAAQALRTGDVAIVVVPAAGGVEYRYDPSRPDAREARLRVDRVVQQSAGRTDPVAVHERKVRGGRRALRGLRGPRAAGDESDGQRDLGSRVRHRGCAAEAPAQAPGGDADVAHPVPGFVRPVAPDLSRARSGAAASASPPWRSGFRSGAPSSSWPGCAC